MFNAWLARQRRMVAAIPVGWQRWLGFVGFGIVWLVLKLLAFVLGPTGWAAVEMGSRAKSRAKKVFAPLLWPAVGLGALALTYNTLGPQDFQALLLLLAAVGLPLYGLKLLVFGKGTKKKGH